MSARLAKPLAATAIITGSVAAWKSVAVAAVLAVTATAAVVIGVRPTHAPHVAADAPALGPAKRTSGIATGRPAGSPSAPPPPTPAPPSPPPSPTPSLAASTAEVPHPRGASAAAPMPRREPVTVAGDPVEAASAPVAADTLGAELALVEEARARYATDPGATLVLLDEHARRFPQGKLVLERELLALDALKRLGRGDDERVRAESLLRVVQGTIYESRVRAHLAQP